MVQPLPHVSVGFLTFGTATAAYLPLFLKSLAAPVGLRMTVRAFDNTPEAENENAALLAAYPEIEVRREGGNLGFSRAYNRLIDRARADRADYFLVINPDTILEPGALAQLVAALEADQGLGSAAPKLRQWDFLKQTKTTIIDSCGLQLKAGLRFIDLGQGEVDRGQYDAGEIIGPSGAAGLYRLSALEAVAEDGQYFDEHFFMYKEDCDLAYRLRLAGFGSRLVSEAIVYHDRTARGGRLAARAVGRLGRGRQVNAWGFMHQHFLWIKYWHRQSFFGKGAVVGRVFLRLVSALIFEPYLLGTYAAIFKTGQDVRRYRREI